MKNQSFVKDGERKEWWLLGLELKWLGDGEFIYWDGEAGGGADVGFVWYLWFLLAIPAMSSGSCTYKPETEDGGWCR